MKHAGPLCSAPVPAGAAAAAASGPGSNCCGGSVQQLNTIIEDSREAESLADSRPPDEDNHNHNLNNNNNNNTKGHGRSGSAAEPFSADGRKWKTPLDSRSLDAHASGSLSPMAMQSRPTRQQHQHQHERQQHIDFDDLYDATDDSDCASCSSSLGHDDGNSEGDTYHHHERPSGNKYPVLLIPPSDGDGVLNSSSVNKDSPVPPTPPPKIPISPAVLSRLPKIVPPVHDAPSLAGSNSASSANPSSASAPPTPDMAPIQDKDWGVQRLEVHSETENQTKEEEKEDSNTPGTSATPQLDVQLEFPEDWSFILDRFPGLPATEERHDLAAARDSESQNSASISSSIKGVQLPTEALATLNGLDLDDRSSQNSASSAVDELGQMCEIVRRPALRRKSTGGLPRSAASATPVSASSFTPLSVPSPGGFFASLGEETRRTWCINSPDPTSSATAEKYYNRPWDASGQTVVEQVVGTCDGDDDGPPTAKAGVSSGPPTARRITPDGTVTGAATLTESLSQDINELVEYDELYESELRIQSSANLDRTSRWLAAQSTYLAALAETNPMNKVAGTRTAIGGDAAEDTSSVSTSKKTVKFLDSVPEEPGEVDVSPPAPRNTLFYRGFQHVQRRSRDRDAFQYSHLRFEATQAARVSLTEKHVDLLSGQYQLADPNRPPYRGPFSLAPRNSTQPETIEEKTMFSKVEKEQDVLRLLYQSMWAIQALKYLNGGRLIPSPAFKRLAKATSPLGTPQSAGSRRRRVVDLGGQTACSWGWYVSSEYPNVKVYTVVPKQQAINPEIKGPPNHRHVSVPQLWNLPLPANQVDLISARNLHMLLKSDRSVRGADEYDMCLRDCFRCLKPGGYLEFFVMDAEITRAGPYGSASSVESAFNLKTRGYDPSPTRGFLSRLRKAGFVKMKRAWMFLPMGTCPPDNEQQSSHTANIPADTSEEGSKATGTTSSVASTTGIFGGWMWEQWMLKLQMEMGRDRDSFLQEMATVFEEGRRTGAGWRCLSGWAMKPRTGDAVPDQPPPPLPPHHPGFRP